MSRRQAQGYKPLHLQERENSTPMNDLEDDFCPICLEKDVQVQLECKHEFCRMCVTSWQTQSKAAPTCPICRHPLKILSGVKPRPLVRVQCQGIKKDGKRCRYKVWSQGKNFCRIHDEDLKKVRRSLGHPTEKPDRKQPGRKKAARTQCCIL